MGNDGVLYPEYNKESAKINDVYWGDDSSLCGESGSPVLPSDVTGLGCAARIMEEGWEMNYEMHPSGPASGEAQDPQ